MSWLKAPLLPMIRALALDQKEPLPATRARLLVEGAFAPNTDDAPEPELPCECSVWPLVRSNWLLGTFRPRVKWDITTMLLTPARTSQMAGVLPPAPTTNGAPLLMIPPRVMSVPPLNSRTPSALVATNWSTSIRPALNWLVPRRRSSALVPMPLATRRLPPSVMMRLFVDSGLKPRLTAFLAKTVPPLLMSKQLSAPCRPTTRMPVLLQVDPAPVTTATLLLAVNSPPRNPLPFRTKPPSVMYSKLPAPELPTVSVPLLLQTDTARVTTATLLLADEVKPRAPKPLRTRPPLLMSRVLPALSKRAKRALLLLQTEPVPVTTATLLL